MRLSEVGLVLFGTTMHFAAFDWIEMLQPTYHSTIFPMLVASSQLFSAQAFSRRRLDSCFASLRSGVRRLNAAC